MLPGKDVGDKQGETIGYPDRRAMGSGGADESQKKVESTIGTRGPSGSDPTANYGISKIEPGIRDSGGQR